MKIWKRTHTHTGTHAHPQLVPKPKHNEKYRTINFRNTFWMFGLKHIFKKKKSVVKIVHHFCSIWYTALCTWRGWIGAKIHIHYRNTIETISLDSQVRSKGLLSFTLKNHRFSPTCKQFQGIKMYPRIYFFNGTQQDR